jgi:uncharacterized protein YndB with AHSA1/START domain
MTTTTPVATATQVYQTYIKATPEAIWDAITKPEFTSQYFHGVTIDTDPKVRKTYYHGELANEAEILEWEPPRKLVHAWVSFYDPEMAAEEPSRVTWEIEPGEGGVSLLTVVHDELENSPKTAAGVSGPGWTHVLSGLKTLLETGEPLVAYPAD